MDLSHVKSIPNGDFKTAIRDLNNCLSEEQQIYYLGRKKGEVLKKFVVAVLKFIEENNTSTLPDSVINLYNNYISSEKKLEEEEEPVNDLTYVEDDYQILLSKELVEYIRNVYNENKVTIKEIAKDVDIPMSRFRTILRNMRNLGYIGMRNPGSKDGTAGTMKTPPKNPDCEVTELSVKKRVPTPKKEVKVKQKRSEPIEEEPSKLASLLSDLSETDMEKENISTYHKELLIEVLHKLIV